ncbi:S-adenosyl-L-methionine-dependent methyltransferase [Podospora fimiseda]|uniref:tRNA wybutosine-synthesizing protein 2 n=1 Tax=Podospora fimiseda TaxID=252190 RepID=A0AAN7GY20_9PEZI|nr:S-adenosyl-L-methionine-dependent methyltransferase [Podospora fimiseda]
MSSPPASTTLTNQNKKNKTKPVDPRPPKPKPTPPITQAISSFLSTLPPSLLSSLSLSPSPLLSTSPTRYQSYPPLLLFPSGSFSSPQWKLLFSSLDSTQLNQLYSFILSKFPGLTHLAINNGIPLIHNNPNENEENDGAGQEEKENLMRQPSNLVQLYGNKWEELWVNTKQNGIKQVWAPVYTMFSRGNIKEKGRILNFGKAGKGKGKGDKGEIVVDMYAGIGYFVFSYVKLGFRVLGWEVNLWSVEGLRRGAEANGFGVRVVWREDEVGGWGNKKVRVGEEDIVVFEEDNKYALGRVKKMLKKGERVKHVNCGFLPSSEGVWEDALGIVRVGWGEEKEEGWLHLHENVGSEEIEQRKKEVEKRLRGWIGKEEKVEVTHCELVKTYAPGVWHLVWDVRVWRG